MQLQVSQTRERDARPTPAHRPAVYSSPRLGRQYAGCPCGWLAGVTTAMRTSDLAAAVQEHATGAGVTAHHAELRQTTNPHRPLTTYAACDACGWRFGLMLSQRRDALLFAIAEHNAQEVWRC